MTCIAVVRDKKGKLVMAGDRRMTWGAHKYQVKPHPKVIKRNKVLIGGTGLGSIIDLVRNLINFPAPTKKDDPYKWVDKIFMPRFIKALTERGYKKSGEFSIPEECRTYILLGVKGELFEVSVESSKSGQSLAGFDHLNTPYATGCGGQLAWGSLLTTQDDKHLSAKERLETALKVTANVSGGCDSNIDVISED